MQHLILKLVLKLFFTHYNKTQIDINVIERPRKSEKFPEILSEAEIMRLIKNISNQKHQAILLTVYACGLRKSELLNLKINDIDSDRMVIRIKQSKGAKDRDISLPVMLLNILRKYVSKYSPKVYLFEGQKGDGAPYSASSTNQILKAALKKSKIKKHITLHSLRHSYATHLVEKNINLRYIQEALGHRSSKTTELYTKLSKEHMAKMVSPIDDWEYINDNKKSAKHADKMPNKHVKNNK